MIKALLLLRKICPFHKELYHDNLSKPYNSYRVIKEIPGVKQGKTIPWFDKTGLGIQYEFPEKYGIDFLLKNKFIEKI